MWRSIKNAQEAVKNGTRRKIRNGMNTNVWGVQWLPDDANECLTTNVPHQLRHTKVQGLMNIEGREWDIDILRDVCNERDLEVILRVPILITKRLHT